MTDLIRPHDKFFKWLMNNRKNARDFLQHYLPENIVHLVDLDDIVILKDSFIDPGYKESFSDIIYETKISGKTGYVYFLLNTKVTQII